VVRELFQVGGRFDDSFRRDGRARRLPCSRRGGSRHSIRARSGAVGLDPWGEHQGRAQAIRGLVHVHSRAVRCDLEQHAPRLAEVDRPEVQPVHDRRHAEPRREQATAPLLLRRGVGRPERDVVDAPRAQDRTACGGAWGRHHVYPGAGAARPSPTPRGRSPVRQGPRTRRRGPGRAAPAPRAPPAARPTTGRTPSARRTRPTWPGPAPACLAAPPATGRRSAGTRACLRRPRSTGGTSRGRRGSPSP
jgi:hypothetical protein